MSAAQVRELPTTVPAITTEIVKISPAIAEKMLGRNVRNRHVSARTVEKYRRAMATGEWTITGEAVKFSASGELLDGQHRLAAVIESGRTVPMMVVKGLPSAAQDVMDTGRARTVGDQLGIAGFTDPSLLAAVARAVLNYEADALALDRPTTTPEVRELVAGNALIGFATSRARAIARGCDLRPAVAGATFYLLMKVDDTKAQVFFERLTDGADLPSGSPILALRARLRTLRDERTRLPTEALVALVFRTWNAWRGGRKLSSLPLYRGGELIPCPEPK